MEDREDTLMKDERREEAGEECFQDRHGENVIPRTYLVPEKCAITKILSARRKIEEIQAKKLLETRVRETKRARANLAAAEKALEAARQRQQELETALSSAMRLERKLREEVAAARKALEGAEAAELEARGPTGS